MNKRSGHQVTTDSNFVTRSVTYGSDLAGVFAHTCYALSVLELDAVRRSTIRALLPHNHGVAYFERFSQAQARIAKGHGGGAKNITTDKFQKTLYNLERHGHILRGEVFIKVLHPRELLDLALADMEECGTHLSVDFSKAIASVTEEVAAAQRQREAPALIERRRLELKRLQRLAEQAQEHGWHRSGRGSVRRATPGETI